MGLMRKITTLVTSIIIYGHELNFTQAGGLGLSIGAMIYNFLDKSSSKKGKKKDPTTGSAAGPAAVDVQRAAKQELSTLLKDGAANEVDEEGGLTEGGATTDAIGDPSRERGARGSDGGELGLRSQYTAGEIDARCSRRRGCAACSVEVLARAPRAPTMDVQQRRGAATGHWPIGKVRSRSCVRHHRSLSSKGTEAKSRGPEGLRPTRGAAPRDMARAGSPVADLEMSRCSAQAAAVGKHVRVPLSTGSRARVASFASWRARHALGAHGLLPPSSVARARVASFATRRFQTFQRTHPRSRACPDN